MPPYLKRGNWLVKSKFMNTEFKLREIKFRGKRIDNGLWVYGSLMIEFSGECFICFWESALIEPENDYREMVQVSFEVHPESVGQYTGLPDTNGKEIYEGDIYNMGDRNILYVVLWRDSGLIGKQISSSSYAGLEHWQDKIEIIGNIYENPELLK
jgi:hypothetical protein